jgi:hypothetical protein
MLALSELRSVEVYAYADKQGSGALHPSKDLLSLVHRGSLALGDYSTCVLRLGTRQDMKYNSMVYPRPTTAKQTEQHNEDETRRDVQHSRALVTELLAFFPYSVSLSTKRTASKLFFVSLHLSLLEQAALSQAAEESSAR